MDLNCDLTTTPVNGAGRLLTTDRAYQTFEPTRSAECRGALPGSSGTSAVESRGGCEMTVTVDQAVGRGLGQMGVVWDNAGSGRGGRRHERAPP